MIINRLLAYFNLKAAPQRAAAEPEQAKRSGAAKGYIRLLDKWVTPFFIPFILFMLGFCAGMIYADLFWIDILNSADLEALCRPN